MPDLIIDDTKVAQVREGLEQLQIILRGVQTASGILDIVQDARGAIAGIAVEKATAQETLDGLRTQIEAAHVGKAKAEAERAAAEKDAAGRIDSAVARVAQVEAEADGRINRARERAEAAQAQAQRDVDAALASVDAAVRARREAAAAELADLQAQSLEVRAEVERLRAEQGDIESRLRSVLRT